VHTKNLRSEGMKGEVFPFKIRVKDPELNMVFQRLAKDRAASIKDRRIAIRIGCKLKPIRRNIWLGSDRKYDRTFIALPPGLELETQKKYFVFKWL